MLWWIVIIEKREAENLSSGCAWCQNYKNIKTVEHDEWKSPGSMMTNVCVISIIKLISDSEKSIKIL